MTTLPDLKLEAHLPRIFLAKSSRPLSVSFLVRDIVNVNNTKIKVQYRTRVIPRRI